MSGLPYTYNVPPGNVSIRCTDNNGQTHQIDFPTEKPCSIFITEQYQQQTLLAPGASNAFVQQHQQQSTMGIPGALEAFQVDFGGGRSMDLFQQVRQLNVEQKEKAALEFSNEIENQNKYPQQSGHFDTPFLKKEIDTTLVQQQNSQQFQQQNFEVQKQNSQQVQQFVESIANQITNHQPFSKFAILEAIKNKDLKQLEIILSQNIDIKVTDQQEGNNIFHLICMQADQNIALQLLQIVFNFDSHYDGNFMKLLNGQQSHNVLGHWPIHEATMKGHCELVENLHQKGAQLNIQTTRTKETCMIMASKSRDKQMVRKLIGLDACVNLIDSSKQAAIHAAIQDGDIELIEYFFANNVDVYDVKNFTKNENIIERCQLHMKERKKRKKKEKHPEYPLDSKRRRRCKCGSQADIKIPS